MEFLDEGKIKCVKKKKYINVDKDGEVLAVKNAFTENKKKVFDVFFLGGGLFLSQLAVQIRNGRKIVFAAPLLSKFQNLVFCFFFNSSAMTFLLPHTRQARMKPEFEKRK